VVETDLKDGLAGLDIDETRVVLARSVGADEGTLSGVGDLGLEVDTGIGRGGILVIGHVGNGDAERLVAVRDEDGLEAAGGGV